MSSFDSSMNDSFSFTKETVLRDYYTASLSREMSLLGRKEVLQGKAKFGIFGDGKEIPQIALAHFFKNGDWRSGYYRDQTLMLATNLLSPQEFFSQLYADSNSKHEPSSGGRQMNCHFSTPFFENGTWLNQTTRKNSSSDISPTGGQMPRMLGLAYASKLYRFSDSLKKWEKRANFSHNGDEIVFGTIGNASTSEGLFWETLNAAGVLQVPLFLCIWDDGYGISVPNEHQMVKGNLSHILSGFQKEKDGSGLRIYTVPGYDYKALISCFEKATAECRKDHTPCVVHVTHLTQPQGHSTSGSHERYKTKERLSYEQEIDGLRQMRLWLMKDGFASEAELDHVEQEAKSSALKAKDEAWQRYVEPLETEKKELLSVLSEIEDETGEIKKIVSDLHKPDAFFKRNIDQKAFHALKARVGHTDLPSKKLHHFWQSYQQKNNDLYDRFLYFDDQSIYRQKHAPAYSSHSEMMDGRQIVQKFFTDRLKNDPRLFIIGEDVGKLGGVNLEFEGLNEIYGDLRITDTGIREATILGQGMGAAFRGLIPIVDIQYLDYLAYCLQGLTDDLATLHYRSNGTQAAPVIVRTKGHRLEGIWHTGSPMGMIINSLPGMYVCVPRNFVQACGMYRTLLNSCNPALVIEVLSGYRLKERCPNNIGTYDIPLGVPEILREGHDITLVTYGACVRIAQTASETLQELGISVELIDIQTLLPFDRFQNIRQSIEKTNCVLFLDEDVPGGATAYMMQKVLEEQGAYHYLDAPAKTLTAKNHRSPYGSDGDYYSKPNVEDVVRTVYAMMHERKPQHYPLWF